MKKTAILLSMLVAFASAQVMGFESRIQAVEDVQPTDEALYVDVRSWAEHQYDGIDGDVHIHFEDILDKIGEYTSSKEQEIKVYCGVGGRAEKARQALMSAGYSNVVNLGGIDDVKKLKRDSE